MADTSPIQRRSVLTGACDMAGLMVPAVPFGLVVGLSVAESSLIQDFVGWSSSALIFGGAAQLTAITLLAGGSSWFAALVAALVVNVRHTMYSAAMVPAFRPQPRWFRWFGPYLLIDQLFALVSVRRMDRDQFRWYYLGAGGSAWIIWQIAVTSGILLGPVVPENLDLSFTVPALFIGLLVPALTTRPAVAAAVTGVAVTAALAGIPNRGGMLVGGLAGVIVGTALDLRRGET